MLPQCLLRSLFQHFLVQNKLGNMGPNLEAWLLCNANRNDLATEQNQHGCAFSFIRFLWGDQADWLLHTCISDNAAALWATVSTVPCWRWYRAVQQEWNCWEILFSGDLNAFPPLRGLMGAHLWVVVPAGQQANGSTILCLSEGKHR